MAEVTEKKRHYNLDAVKSVPIADVCESLGIAIMNNKIKIRDEKTASAQIYPETNTWHDFGSGKTGNVIQLVQAYSQCDFYTAICCVAQVGGVEPEHGHSIPIGLTYSEWAKLGIAGDIASKNFDIDLAKQSPEEAQALSERGNMSMNELKRSNPEMYVDVVYKRAISTVRQLRSDYYFDVYSTHKLCKDGNMDWHSIAATRFTDEIKQLRATETLLKRACYKTRIKAFEVGIYEPEKDIQKIFSGEIKFDIGTYSYGEMQRLAKICNTVVKYYHVPVENYEASLLEDFCTSAKFIKGNVLIGYLESDYKKIRPVLAEMGKEQKSRSQPEPSREDDDELER